MKPFDLSTAPLEGVSLIEASAGTGKTFTLTGLCLRLIVEQGLRIDQILVVTFTNAATAELKERIRNGLHSARAAFQTGDTDVALLADLMCAVTDRDLAVARIRQALADFDRAAIFTIHGFCQRILQNYAFETGHPFQVELLQDATPLIQETVDDFWRRHFNAAPEELVTFAVKNVGGPERLARTLAYSRYLRIEVIAQDQKPVLSAIKPWRQAAAEVARLWPAVRDDIQVLLEYDGLNARYYGKTTPTDASSGPAPRHHRIRALGNAMDRWDGHYPLFDQFDRFTTSFLRKATKKGFETPRHRFFDGCETALHRQNVMEEQLVRYVTYLKAQLITRTRERLSHKKALRNVLFFDDLLLNVHEALSDARGDRLAQAVRSQYRAALVDEFQDTDALQYRIFSLLFAQPPHFLAMIGDPKQAIYGFRGADLYSYLQAVERADDRTTLTHNWRSTQGLVKAVNTIFERCERPFGLEEIVFEKAQAAVVEPDEPLPALRLWYLDPDGSAKTKGPISQTEAVPMIANAVAREVVELLASSSERYLPGDIAILTRSHYQAGVVKAALVSRAVPAVLSSAGRIYDTAEAQEMIRILSAAAVPADPARVRAALCTDWIGVPAETFDGYSNEQIEAWHSHWAAFHTYHRTWSRHGFYRMFRRLMVQERVRTRLLAAPEGERRMTNILHLAELLHQAESEHRPGPEGLVKWLVSKRNSREPGDQDQQLRLESDARAVRIITTHKSKGLQFNVVFCPFTWGGIRVDDNAAVFHDSERADRLTLALGPGIDEKYVLQARKEALAENLRLLYVALTRACRRCYWVWGRIRGSELSAPAYLIHADVETGGGRDAIASLNKKMARLTQAQLVSELSSLADRSDGTIEISPLPTRASSICLLSEETIEKPLTCRRRRRAVRSDWRIASFSALTAGLSHVDREKVWDDRDADNAPDDRHDAEQGRTLFAFPKGIQAGLFFHDLLEQWHPEKGGDAERKKLISDKLRAHRLDPSWVDAVDRLLEDLAHMPLEDSRGTFCLKQVRASNRINEMEFHYRLQSIDARRLQETFDRHAARRINACVTPAWRHVRFEPVQGFLKGYIDSIFRYRSRYYLIDWKSNYLGPTYADYDDDKLALVMARQYYFLQYHLYVLALDQWLRNRVPGYDYGKHFGGIFYIFLRGVQTEPGRPNGAFFDLPKADLVQALNRLLIAQ